MVKQHTPYHFLKALFISAFILVGPKLIAQSTPIEFVHADKVTNAIIFPNATKAIGHVHFRHGNKNLFCDSAYFHQSQNWVKAYGTVQINQADTLNLFCDSLHYDGNTNIGILKSNVRFRDNEFKMTTDSLEFDANKSIGYYSNWANISSINNDLNLTSKKGYYYANSKTFFFKDSVNITHPSYQLKADTLEFRTNTETVYFHGPTIITLDSTKVNCNKGFYKTNDEFLNLWNGATIISDSTSTLYADSIIYDQKTEIAEGYDNVSVYDSLENIELRSEYLVRYPNNSRLILKENAQIFQYNKKDTLYLRADTIYQSKDTLTNKSVSIAINNVVIINSGAVGICDSIYYNQTDSIIKLRQTPILWQDMTQLSGDSIDINLIDNNFDKIILFDNAMVITEHDSIHYDQLSGKQITANFKQGDIHQIFIDGNSQTLYYPSETSTDSLKNEIKTLQGKNQLMCEQIYVFFKKSEVQKIKFVDQPEASFLPLEQIPEKELFLQNFIWKIEQKPSAIIPK